MKLVIKQVPLAEKQLLKELLQIYFKELSQFFEEGINDDEYKYLDLYWTEKDRIPLFIYAGDALGGACVS